MGIEHQKVILYERGDHTYLAPKLAESFAEAWHYIPILGRQPKIKEDLIGSGIDGVEKIDNFEEYKDKADLIIFPGEFDGETCDLMWKEGRRAFGSGMSAELEIDRILFLETLKKLGLPMIRTYVADGLDDAEEYLTRNDNKVHWIKLPYCRGEFDTQKFENMKTFKGWLDYQRLKLGAGGSANVKLLIQNNYPAVIEGGGDRYIVKGKLTQRGTIGYEKKDKWYIYKIVNKFPAIIDDIDKKLEPEFKRLGYSGAYSNELRKNQKDTARLTDITARFGEPPTSGICESYTTFNQDIYDVANGDIPEMDFDDEYGAIIILDSYWNEDHEICVDFPKEIESNVKLKHSYKLKKDWHCIPNESSGYFGAVSAKGKTLKEAITKVTEYADQIICLGLGYTKINLEEAEKMVADGRQFGLEM